MKYREFICTEGPVLELNPKEHPAFFLNMQRAVLMSLEKKKLLTSSQRERCAEILEKQYRERCRERGVSDGSR